jgi:hypothetical protein
MKAANVGFPQLPVVGIAAGHAAPSICSVWEREGFLVVIAFGPDEHSHGEHLPAQDDGVFKELRRHLAQAFRSRTSKGSTLCLILTIIAHLPFPEKAR